MIYILVQLEVRDYEAFEKFELFAIGIMKTYQGKLVSVFEIERTEDGEGREIHLLEFPNEEQFEKYKNDPELAKKNDLRSKAISNTSISISTAIKSYA